VTSRVITGAGLVLLVLFSLYFGGWVFSILWAACVCIALFEMFHVLSAAGHRIIAWPTWTALVIAIPGFLLLTEVGSLLLLVLLVVTTLMLVSALVMFRDQPRLEDLITSVLPLFTVALPGMSLLGMTRIAPIQMQRVFLGLAFFIPILGDTSAFFIGSRYGKRKLNPQVSPNKTMEGAAAGLVGSIAASCAIYFIGSAFNISLPSFPHFLTLGMVGGIVGQLGDLFASLVKRHCGVKDYGHIFPGHGGMMDRLDSILFTGTVVYLYQAVLMV